MNLIRTFKSIQENVRNEVCCDTTLIASDGTKIKINFVIFHVRNSWLKTFYNNEENVLLFPDCNFKDLSQFVTKLYNLGDVGHRDFGENYIQEIDEKSHNQEILTKSRLSTKKYKPSENIRKKAGPREGNIKRKFSTRDKDGNDDDEDNIIVKRPKTLSVGESNKCTYEKRHFVLQLRR